MGSCPAATPRSAGHGALKQHQRVDGQVVRVSGSRGPFGRLFNAKRLSPPSLPLGGTKRSPRFILVTKPPPRLVQTALLSRLSVPWVAADVFSPQPCLECRWREVSPAVHSPRDSALGRGFWLPSQVRTGVRRGHACWEPSGRGSSGCAHPPLVSARGLAGRAGLPACSLSPQTLAPEQLQTCPVRHFWRVLSVSPHLPSPLSP